MKKIIRMEKIVPEMRQTIDAVKRGTGTLFDTLNPQKLSAASVDEGIFPDEILECIERRREHLLKKMEIFMEKEKSNTLELYDRVSSIEEIKTTIRVILLEIEKLQAQTGTACVKECDRMVSELESINKKVQSVNYAYRKLYYVTLSVFILTISIIIMNMLSE
ncbi:hypothetical protein NEIRO03_2231 [Nematocida sp. AWRm78]|nr:hypothetical protein NEIRO02_1691 [Nematocida sp. AWRm79]KAI5186179.1 hypothetical protein NEIRO03_2231 [Nematocida sp. AWRm78]